MSDANGNGGEEAAGKLDRVIVATEDLRITAEDMEEAAWREGIEPTGPLGIWVHTLRKTLVKLAEVVEEQHQMLKTAVTDVKVLGETELAQLHTARRLAEAELERAGTALRTLEIKRKTLTTEMVQVIAPGLREELKQAIVIRERRWNRNVEWGRYAAVAAVALAVFLGGYGWRTWQDAKTMAAVEQCDLHPISDAKGTHYCYLEPLLSP